MAMYWYSGSWQLTDSLYAYSGSAWHEAQKAYIRSGSVWLLAYNSSSVYVKVSDVSDYDTNVVCLSTTYTNGLKYRLLTAELVDDLQNPVSNDFGSPIDVVVQFDTYYNNGCGSPGTTTLTVTIATGSTSNSSSYTAENVTECGSGCGTEGINNPCVNSVDFAIPVHPSSSVGAC